MAARDENKSEPEFKSRTLSKPAVTSVEPAEPVEAHSQRKRPESGRYLLQVDRQTKGSYPTLDAAMRVGTVIKTKHPIVQVGVYDAVDCVNSPVEAAANPTA